MALVLLGEAGVVSVLSGVLGPRVGLTGWRLAGVGSAALVTWLALQILSRSLSRRVLDSSGPEIFRSVARTGFGVLLVLLVVAVLAPRLVPQWPPVAVAALTGGSLMVRWATRISIWSRRRAGKDLRRAVVVGEPSEVIRRTAANGVDPYSDVQIVGCCLPNLLWVAGMEPPILGSTSDIPQVVVDCEIDAVLVCEGALRGEALRRLKWALDVTGVELFLDLPESDVSLMGGRILNVGGHPVLSVDIAPAMKRQALAAKRALDVLLGSLLLIIAGPMIAVGGIAVRLTSPGPALYRQTRVGANERAFSLWKMRSMYLDADARRDAYIALISEGGGPMFMIRRDPRVTPVGRILRRYSIDELPQLWNVIKGDMSLVGPRPPLEGEVATYADHVWRRLHVRPGLTGLWQVSGRADLSWEDSIRLDLRYVDNWSLSMDLLILWRTFRAVLGSGAY
jgi:exopolysaccharide biosynthesis polyprenyl glycosylphosphotransferase